MKLSCYSQAGASLVSTQEPHTAHPRIHDNTWCNQVGEVLDSDLNDPGSNPHSDNFLLPVSFQLVEQALHPVPQAGSDTRPDPSPGERSLPVCLRVSLEHSK